MKRALMALAALPIVAACSGGNPFEATGVGVDPDDPTNAAGIPTALANDLDGYAYNPGTGILTITGITSDDSPFQETYARNPALDRGGYLAYTQQDGSLDRHSTAYVKSIRGTSAVVVATGGQFGYYFAGTAYDNSSYSAPLAPNANDDGGLVQYIGNYVGTLNSAGSGEDLLPIDPGTDPGFVPSQIAEITGRVMITASFSDASVDGIVTGRQVDNTNLLIGTNIADLELAPTSIEPNGTFYGEVTQNQTVRGEYGGIFGGVGATEVAGTLHAQAHISGLATPEEYGMFVLAQCGTAGDDVVCDQPNP